MTKIAQVDRGRALTNPEAEFATPSDLLEAKLLTRGEKLKALDQWKLDVQNRLDAADEGMPPPSGRGEESKSGDSVSADADLLRQIELAVSTIDSDG